MDSMLVTDVRRSLLTIYCPTAMRVEMFLKSELDFGWLQRAFLRNWSALE